MNSIDKPTHAINLVKIKKLLKGKVFPSVALSESVNNLVHTVNNNFVPIRALNAHDSEAVQPILPHRAPKVVFKRRSPLNERSAQQDVGGMTARMDATFENSGIISYRLFAFNTSMTSAGVFIDFLTCAALN